MSGAPSDPQRGPPPLAPFGLVLHHDGSWSHENEAFTNRKLRELFDRSVRFLPDASKFVVQVGHFRGEIEVEEAGFFVRSIDLATGRIRLSDGSEEGLEIADLASSERDGALLCRVKRQLAGTGLLARFDHAAQADFMNAVEADDAGAVLLRIAGRRVPLPPL